MSERGSSGFVWLAVASALVATSAPAYQVERWSTEWHGYTDDFEDGVLPDGDPGEPDAYLAVCGTLDDGDESNGRIRLLVPSAECPTGRGIAPKILLGQETTLRVRFDPVQLPIGSYLAIRLGNQPATQRLTLMLRRGSLTGPGTDDLGVLLYYNTTTLEGVLLSLAPDAWLASAGTVELELSTVPGPNGDTAVPHGRFRTCALAGCTSFDAFTDLADQPGAPPGAVASGQRLQADFGIAAPSAAIADILDWSVTTRFADEFDGTLSDRAQYVGNCAEGDVAGGALAVTPATAACGNWFGSLTAAVTSPGPATTQATLAFSVPPPCHDSVAIGLSADHDLVTTPDGAMLWLSRGPIPGIGDDVLYVVLEAEAEPPLRPWLGLHVLSTTPDSFGAGIDSIELRVAHELDLASGDLLPHASVRTCAGTDCALAGAPFLDLAPFSFPQDDPDLVVCSALAAHRAPPADGGAMNPEAPRISYLLFAPEPAGALMAAAAVATCAALARRRAAAPR